MSEINTQAGRSIEQFAGEAGISRASVYTLPDDCKPRSVKIGKRRVIIESPADWLARMAERGGVVAMVPYGKGGAK